MNKLSVILPFGKRMQSDKTKRKCNKSESLVFKGSSTQTVCLQTGSVLGKDEVTGSNPVSSSKKIPSLRTWNFFYYYFLNSPFFLGASSFFSSFGRGTKNLFLFPSFAKELFTIASLSSAVSQWVRL